MIDPKLVTRPAGTKLFSGASRNALIKEGEQLFSDPALGTNGLTCSTCHTGPAGFQASFAKPYPHTVAMAEGRAGLSTIDADEFVQFCIAVPLKGKPLPWESKKLAALTAYVVDVKQKEFKTHHAANPCAQKHRNPCAKKPANPCNPCAGKQADPEENRSAQAAMKSFVTTQTSGNGFMPVIYQGKILQLKLAPSAKYPDAFHHGVKKEGRLFASCADFIDPISGSKYDIDFLVNKTGDLFNVVQPIVHSIDGVKNPYDLSH